MIFTKKNVLKPNGLSKDLIEKSNLIKDKINEPKIMDQPEEYIVYVFVNQKNLKMVY